MDSWLVECLDDVFWYSGSLSELNDRFAGRRQYRVHDRYLTALCIGSSSEEILDSLRDRGIEGLVNASVQV